MVKALSDMVPVRLNGRGCSAMSSASLTTTFPEILFYRLLCLGDTDDLLLKDVWNARQRMRQSGEA